MIAAWLAYSVVVATLLYVGARALELVAHAVNIGTRFIWVAAMAGAFLLSTRQLVRAGSGVDAPAPSLERRIARRVLAAAPVVLVKRQLDSLVPQRTVGQAMRTAVANGIYGLARTRGAIHGVDVAPLDSWNRTLLVSWFVVAAALAGFVVVAFGRLRAMGQTFERRTVDGVPVAVSDEVGPALFGIARPHIVVPRWVLDLTSTERRIILAHETEHAVARDPLTLVGALLLLIVQPWNLALWAMFARLRLAIEMDCDRRVLGTAAEARRYGELLVLVHSRRADTPQPLLSFVARRSNLERRIRRITSRRSSYRLVTVAITTTGFCLAAAAWTPAPAPTHRVNPTILDGPPRPLDVSFPRRDGTIAGRSGDENVLVVRQPAREICGMGSRVGELCSIDGRVVVRVMDSTRVLISVRSTSSDASSPADHLFVVTSLDPLSRLLNRSIAQGHLEFQDGWLFLVDRINPDAQVFFGSAPADRASDRHLSALRINRLIGLGHYAPSPVSIDDVMDLRPCQPANEEGCFVARGRKVAFP
jgi:hypothetical protein